MPYPDFISPVLVQLGPLQIRWYGLMYVFGFLFAAWFIPREAARRGVPMDKEKTNDLIFYLVLGVLLGGRLGYVLFYNLPYYISKPWELIAIWHGGMSFHGGLLGVTVAIFLFVRKFKIPLLQLLDLAALAAPVGLGLGRLGNFINGELWGKPSNVPWAIIFPLDPQHVARHPSQLYEAGLEGILLFGILYAVSRKNPPWGSLAGLFLMGYGLARTFVEFFREPDAQMFVETGGRFLGLLSMGQILSLPLVLAGLSLLVWSVKANRQYPRTEPIETAEATP